jgi:hypothetical protein
VNEDEVYEQLGIRRVTLKQRIILECVKDEKWQEIRLSMKGTTTAQKVQTLREWLDYNDRSFSSRVQVINYVNALKRGGQVK